MDFIAACKNLIAIDTTPGNGTGEAAKFLAELAQSFGFATRIEPEVSRGLEEANLICFPHGQSAAVHLLLQTHLDTVDPGSFSLWTQNERNPFRAAISSGKIFGLGSADTKLDFLCKLYAAADFIGRPSPRAFAVAGTYGEEYNMNGAIRLIRNKHVSAKRILVSEPTDFHLVYAGKGLANIEITVPFSPAEVEAKQYHDQQVGQSTQSRIFRGKATHSSQPHLGENAIEKLIDYLEKLPDQLLILEMDGGTNYNTVPVQAVLEFDSLPVPGRTLNQKIIRLFHKIRQLQKTFVEHLDKRFDPPMTTLNVGMVRTFSDHLKIMGCVRWPEGLTEATYTGWMNELRQTCEEVEASFVVRDFKKPFFMDPKSEFASLCLAEIQKEVPASRLMTQPVTNEANVFHRLGLETLAFGPGGREGNSQTPQESIEIDKLHKAVKIYKSLIEKICY